MRGKIKSHKIVVILVASIVVIISISLFVINILDDKQYKAKNIINKEDKVINEISSKDDDIELEEIVEDKGEESATKEIKTEVSNTPKTNNNSSNQTSSKKNTQTNINNNNNNENTSTSSQNQTTTNTTSNNEVKQTQPSVDLTQVASTNDINYGIHKGIVEFSTKSGCEKAGNDIVDIELNQVIAYNAENNNSKSVDIQYPACYQVTSQANTIMGYYLNIFCESGNCNRYKSLVNISNYD